MKKKLLSMVLAGILCLSLTACGTKSENAAKAPAESAAAATESKAAAEPEAAAEVSQETEKAGEEGRIVLNWEDNYLNSKLTEQYADLYNQSQDKVFVKASEATYGSSAEYYEALSLKVASGGDDALDIFSISPAFFNKYVGAGTAYCVDQYILNNDDIKDYAVDAVTRDGKAYAFPATNDIVVLFVNADMLEGSGHTLEDLKTWSGMLEAATDISEEYNNYGCLAALSFGSGWPEFLWYPTMWSAGGDIVENTDGSVEITNPSGIAKAAMAWKELLTGDAGSTEFSVDNDYLINGTCGMMIYTHPNMKDYAEAESLNWAVVPVPATEEGGQAYGTLGGWFSMVNAQSEHAEEAAEFLNWLYFESDFVSDMALDNFQLSPLKSADAKLDALYKDSEFSAIYTYLESGELKTKAELALDSRTLESVSQMLTGVIYEAATEEEAEAKVQEMIEALNATVTE